MIKAILFDMDGTLLPMDMDIFIGAYFKALAEKLSPHGYDSAELTDAIWQGTGAMIKNNGSQTNEEVFWNAFSQKCGERVLYDKALFNDFYLNEFNSIKSVCGFDPSARKAVELAKELTGTVALASNPIFPLVAQKSRAIWAGIDTELFDYVTGYENSRFCKPSLEYYRDIADVLSVRCEECLMIGNDVGEDMCAAELGMEVFLVTPGIINRNDADISGYRRGNLSDLYDYLETLRR